MTYASTQEARAAQAEHRERRAAAGRERRAEAVRLLDGRTLDGEHLLVACSRTLEGVAYVLRRDGNGAWQCGCLGHRWRGRCSHAEAAEAREVGA